MLHGQYFADIPLYDNEFFRCRFRMPRAIFDEVLTSVVEHNDYFWQKTNCAGNAEIAARVKVIAAPCILTYGLPPDAVDEYLTMSETTARVALKRFCLVVAGTFGQTYFCAPSRDDIN